MLKINTDIFCRRPFCSAIFLFGNLSVACYFSATFLSMELLSEVFTWILSGDFAHGGEIECKILDRD